MLDSIWGDDGKQDDTNGPKGYYMKYDSNKGTFVSIGDGSNTTAGTKAVTAKSLKLSAWEHSIQQIMQTERHKNPILRTSM